MPVNVSDHSKLQNLSFGSSGHTGFGSAAQGQLAETALQVESDPIYQAEKALYALKSEIPNIDNYETKVNFENLITIIENQLANAIPISPVDDFVYGRQNGAWIRLFHISEAPT